MKIRLWKLGSLEHKIYPNQIAINKLKEILSVQTNEMDIVWGPAITVQEINVDKDDLNLICKATPEGYKAKVVLERNS